MTREEALACSLEWLELLLAAHQRRRAGELLELMQVFNVAQGTNKNAWEQMQRKLQDKIRNH